MLYKFATLSDYLKYIEQHKNEINLLYEDLLIHVTSFFRDPESVEYIKKTILPRIFINKSGTDPIRILIPACSTGEEAYSMAMICIEIMGERSASVVVQIFATDLSKQSVAKARLGNYKLFTCGDKCTTIKITAFKPGGNESINSFKTGSPPAEAPMTMI